MLILRKGAEPHFGASSDTKHKPLMYSDCFYGWQGFWPISKAIEFRIMALAKTVFLGVPVSVLAGMYIEMTK